MGGKTTTEKEKSMKIDQTSTMDLGIARQEENPNDSDDHDNLSAADTLVPYSRNNPYLTRSRKPLCFGHHDVVEM
jgi:hypothetical protein